ncbi:TonB-dependent receptor [Rheinheimera texasensis]|uniref:TonB-dependent receptor n=1 Tax=Rheinheimera texasensis TaxID=306205 RepID=UPI0032B28F5C
MKSQPLLHPHRLSRAISLGLCLTAVTISTAYADAALSGRITDNQQRLLPGAEVVIRELKLSRTTAADGRFVFPKLPAGSYTLQVRYVGAALAEQTVIIAADPLQLGDIKLRAVDNSLEHVEVTGQSGAVSKALSRQRNAAGIVTVASTDEMGQFPDSNASEALQRLAGVSVERDQGEGRFVRVRGLAPDYNAVTYNGTSLAAPEAGRRAVALDVIPSDLLESVEVSKTLTPDMPAGSLGGTIEIKSLSAFDRSHDFYSFTAEAGHNSLVDKQSPKLSGVATRLFDVGANSDSLGIAFAASIAKRKFGSDNSETGGKWDFGDGKAALEEFEQRDYLISRERLGLALNADYRPDSLTEYYVRTLYSRFTDDESRQALITEFDSAQLAGATGKGKLVRELKQREEQQSISAVVLGTKQQQGAYEWQLEAGSSQADEDTPFNIAGAAFTQKFKTGLGFQGGDMLQLIAPDAAYLADGYSIDEVEMGETYTKEQEHNVRADLSREFIASEGVWQLKTGLKISQREKTARETVWAFEDFADAGVKALSLGQYSNSLVDFAPARFGPAIDAASIYSLVNSLDKDDYIDDVESAINNFKADEQLTAAYLMAQWEGDLWHLVAGARYEHEQRDSSGIRYDGEQDSFTATNADTSHGDWLPALISRYQLNENSQIRASYSRSLVRPNFAQLAPAYLLEEDDGELEASFGNPELKSLTSDNLDVGVEYYADGLGVLSAMVFYKDIQHFIYQADLAGSAGYENFAVAETYRNGDQASLSGLELNAVHQLSGFGNWLDRMLLSANLTLTRSDASLGYLDDGQWQQRDITLPSQSDRTANIAIGYETEALSLRLAANYKSAYLAEVGALDDAAYDVYADDHLQLDFSSKYQWSDSVQLYFNIVNLNDEPYYAYTGQRYANFQYEQYGRSFALGLQISH